MINESKSSYALITGASLGIGKAIAFELAAKNHNLILVALPGRELEQTAVELRLKFSVDVLDFGVDLTREETPEEIYDFVQSRKISINILINNAGRGTSGMFHRSDRELNNYMVKLNNMAMVGISHLFINMLLAQPEAWIMNVSSMEATLPLPYKTVYTATKAFIYAFSLALNEELKGTNVSVCVLCPGGVLTTEDGLKRAKSMGWKAKIMIKSPDFVAKKAISDMFKGKLVSIPGIVPYAIVKIMKLFPTKLKMKTLEKVFRAYKDH
ncbi:SDR family NAD(P)-dependent oxidoreductase [Bacteroidota bacterium]